MSAHDVKDAGCSTSTETAVIAPTDVATNDDSIVESDSTTLPTYSMSHATQNTTTELPEETNHEPTPHTASSCLPTAEDDKCTAHTALFTTSDNDSQQTINVISQPYQRQNKAETEDLPDGTSSDEADSHHSHGNELSEDQSIHEPDAPTINNSLPDANHCKPSCDTADCQNLLSSSRHAGTTTVLPTAPLTDSEVSELPDADNTVNMVTSVTPTRSDTINKISQTKREEHQHTAYAQWQTLSEEVARIRDSHTSYTVLVQNLEGGMNKINKWINSEDMSDETGTVSLPTQIQQTQPKVFIGLEMWGSDTETTQDQHSVETLFAKCGLQGTARVATHSVGTKRAGVVFWHHQDLTFQIYRGIHIADGRRGEPATCHPDHEGRFLIALGEGDDLFDDYLAIYAPNPGKEMGKEDWFNDFFELISLFQEWHNKNRKNKFLHILGDFNFSNPEGRQLQNKEGEVAETLKKLLNKDTRISCIDDKSTKCATTHLESAGAEKVTGEAPTAELPNLTPYMPDPNKFDGRFQNTEIGVAIDHIWTQGIAKDCMQLGDSSLTQSTQNTPNKHGWLLTKWVPYNSHSRGNVASNADHALIVGVRKLGVEAIPHIQENEMQQICEEVNRCIKQHLEEWWKHKRDNPSPPPRWMVAEIQFNMHLEQIDSKYGLGGRLVEIAVKKFEQSTETLTHNPAQGHTPMEDAVDNIVENAPVWWTEGNQMPLDLAVQEYKNRTDIPTKESEKSAQQFRQSLRSALFARRFKVATPTYIADTRGITLQQQTTTMLHLTPSSVHMIMIN